MECLFVEKSSFLMQSDLRTRHREETKQVTKLTLENVSQIQR